MGLLDSTSTQTNTPWKPAQPYITTGMKTASTLLKNGTGFNAPTFQTWVPMSAQTTGGLGSIWDAAQGGNPLAGQSEDAISGILGGDISQRYGDLYNNAVGGGFNQRYEDLYNNAYNGDFDQRYGDLYANADNAHFATATQNQADQIANDVQRQFSGMGRLNSTADSGALVDQIGRFREQALSDNWNQNIANQRGILGDQVTNWNQNIANQRGILGDQANNWNQNIANQRGILGDQTNSYLSAVAAAPGAYQQRFLPGQAMGQVGSAYDDLAARELQAKVDTFNTTQQAPWQRLQAYTGAISGTGGNASGFASQSVTKPFDWLGALGSGLESLGLGKL